MDAKETHLGPMCWFREWDFLRHFGLRKQLRSPLRKVAFWQVVRQLSSLAVSGQPIPHTGTCIDNKRNPGACFSTYILPRPH